MAEIPKNFRFLPITVDCLDGKKSAFRYMIISVSDNCLPAWQSAVVFGGFSIMNKCKMLKRGKTFCLKITKKLYNIAEFPNQVIKPANPTVHVYFHQEMPKDFGKTFKLIFNGILNCSNCRTN